MDPPISDLMAPAPATSLRKLPRSNHQRSIASATTATNAGSNPPLYEVPPHGNTDVEPQDPEFFHPEHVIPPRDYAGIDTLIAVCCHAIFHPDASHGSFPLNSPHDEENWHLAPFQKSDPVTGKPGEHETFLAHISAGLDALTTGPCAGRSLLVFSGGPTKSPLTPLSEARSYYHAALGHALSRGELGGGHVKALFEKGWILLEERSADSFLNLLYSILLFRQTTGRYPREIRIITHAFKARRFLHLHAPTIQWPANRIRVQGTDPVMSSAEHDDTVSGEERFGYGPWKDDPFGTGELLSRKRKQRGWEESASKELGDGLEDSVQQLLQGKAVGELPWCAPATAQRVDSIAIP